MTDITVPALGESVTEATVGQWLKAAGDTVSKDEVLVELETDKVSIEVSAPEAGVLSDIMAPEGETVEIGALLGKLNGGASAAPSAPAVPVAAAPAPVQTAAPVTASGGSIDVAVPTMGESVAEGTLSTFLKNIGDTVTKDDIIAEIETDKVALEVPANAAGVITEFVVNEGDSVTPGAVIARISSGAAAAAPVAMPAPVPAAATGERPVSPAVRRVAAEAGVNPANIPGTGRDGRATKADAMSYVADKPAAASGAAAGVAAASAAAAVASAAKPAASATARPPREDGPREERVRMTRLRQTIARRLKEAQNNAAMLTTFNDVDMSAVMDLRKRYKESFLEKHGVKLGFMGFFVKACVNALKEVPDVNAEIDGTDVIYKNFYNMGIAVGTDRGLVVPVVRDCDQMTLAEVEAEIARLAGKARDGDLAISDMQGGTFTITNGGVYGSLMSTPILNPPQSGVLGMHRIEQRPVVINGEVKARPMMYLALSYDHRIVDGKGAVTFLVRVKENLEDPERLLLDV